MAKKKVVIVKQELHERPMEVAQNAIIFLTTLLEDQTKRFDIQNRFVIIYGARKVVGKHRMLDTVQAKIDFIDLKVKEVIELFKPLVNKGIPFFWEEKGPLLSQKEYLDKLVNCKSDHSKFEYMQQALSGRVVFDKLAEEFELLFDFKVSCAKVPNFSYTDNMELIVMAHDMVVAYFPKLEQWNNSSIWIN